MAMDNGLNMLIFSPNTIQRPQMPVDTSIQLPVLQTTLRFQIHIDLFEVVRTETNLNFVTENIVNLLKHKSALSTYGLF